MRSEIAKECALLEQLANLLSAASAAVRFDDVQRFARLLVDQPGSLFTSATVMASNYGGAFFSMMEYGNTAKRARHWAAWPMRRLFAVGTAAIISDKASGVQALAVPFVMEDRDYVVIAPLGSAAAGPSEQAFLRSLCSVRLCGASASPASKSAEQTRFLWLGGAEPFERVRALLENRGWTLIRPPSFRAALEAIAGDTADVVIAGADLTVPVRALCAVHRVSLGMDVSVLLFHGGAQTAPELHALADRHIACDASDAHIVRALKDLAHLVPVRRRDALLGGVERSRLRAELCETTASLAQFIAEASLHVGACAAGVALMDSNGQVNYACEPANALPADFLPNTLLDGVPMVYGTVSDGFFSSVTDDAATARKLRAMQPLSAASLPLVASGKVLGALTVFGIKAGFDDGQIDGFFALASLGAQHAATLQERAQRQAGVPSRSPWSHYVVPAVRIDAYHGEFSNASMRVALPSEAAMVIACARARDREQSEAVTQKRIDGIVRELAFAHPLHILERAADGERGIAEFYAIVTPDSRVYHRYNGYPRPLQIAPSRPSALLSEETSEGCSSFQLTKESALLCYERSMARRADIAQFLAEIAEGGSPGNPAAALIDNEVDNDCAFVCLTTPRSE